MQDADRLPWVRPYLVEHLNLEPFIRPVSAPVLERPVAPVELSKPVEGVQWPVEAAPVETVVRAFNQAGLSVQNVRPPLEMSQPVLEVALNNPVEPPNQDDLAEAKRRFGDKSQTEVGA